MVRRISLLREEVTDACRLLSGEAEDVPGLIVERFGPALVIHVQQPLPLTRRQLAQVAHWYRQWLPVRSVCVYHVPRGSSGMKPGDSGVMLRTVLGRKLPDEIIVSENGLRFAVRIRETTAVGLYPSHRENRARVRALAAGREVLNLFAYTCGFSVAAAMGGADRVVSVDLSAAHLEWGKHNFELNGLDPGPHAFLSSDALDYLKRAARRGESFDLIVLDPPTFAHGRRRGKDFSVSRDLAELVTGAVRLLRPNGMMLVSTNYRRMSFDGLRRHIRRGAAGRRIKKMQFVPLPPDYAVDPDHAKSVIVHFA
ncbi:MAG: class I SAM-dependent rRNA methyltransferase [Planctomycetota bacterium]|nr:MAG: class I SAM-dependent rRNA methyltransferase [Planctomycetota bacterium]